MNNPPLNEVLNEVFNMVAWLLDGFSPLIVLAIGFVLSITLINALRRMFFDTNSQYEGRMFSQYEADSRNYSLRTFDMIAGEIRSLVPDDSPILSKLPAYRQSVKTLSEISSDVAIDAIDKILAGMKKIRDTLITQKAVVEVSKNKRILADLEEQILRLNDDLEATFEVKLPDVYQEYYNNDTV